MVKIVKNEEKNNSKNKKKLSEIKEASKLEDLAFGIANLINAEEHLAVTYKDTKNKEYLELLDRIRELRRKVMLKLIKRMEGELWCCSKHLLEASIRMFEVANKEKEDKDLFNETGYELLRIVIGLQILNRKI